MASVQTDNLGTNTFALQKWIVLVAASSLFFYTFIQMNMFNPISSMLMKDFSLTSTQLGNLHGLYFYGNFFLVFPAGLILDRVSARNMLLIALAIASASMFAFAYFTDLWLIGISHLIMGLCGSFAFLSAIRIVSRWFEPRQMALASGLVVTLAMLGGVVAQTPLAILTQHVGWHWAIRIYGFIGFGLLLFVFTSVQDFPKDYKRHEGANDLAAIGFWRSIRMVVANRYNWLGGLYTTLMNLPIFIFGIWGIIYLTQAKGLTTMQAANASLLLFVGTLIGSPLVGWISDRIRRRIMPMFVGAALSLVIVFAVMYMPLSVTTMEIMFFLLGLITSTQVLSYSTIAELNSPLLTGSAIGIISFLIMASGFIAPPAFGWFMNVGTHSVVNGVTIFAASAFKNAMWIMPIGFAVSFFIAIFIKETRGKQVYTDAADESMDVC